MPFPSVVATCRRRKYKYNVSEENAYCLPFPAKNPGFKQPSQGSARFNRGDGD